MSGMFGLSVIELAIILGVVIVAVTIIAGSQRRK